MRPMPPNAAPRMSGMNNMHQQQPVHSQAQLAQAQQQQQSSSHQATGQPASQANPGKQQPKRVAVKLSTTSRGGSRETAEHEPQPTTQWDAQRAIRPLDPNSVPQPPQPQPPQPQPPVSAGQVGQSNFIVGPPESPSMVTSGPSMTASGGGQQQHHHQCASSGSATISGLTQTITTSASSNTSGLPTQQAPPPPPPTLIGAPAPMPRDELMDDLSECSCSSNSLNCSLDDPGSHSISSQLDQPLLGGAGGLPPPGHQHQHPPMANHYPQPHQHHHHDHHHHPHQHQRPVHHHQHHHQRGHMPPPPPQNDIYRGQQQQQHHHYYNKQQQHFHHHPDQPVYSQHGRAPQAHSQYHHRPLLPNASMPPSLSSAATPPPAALFRHSTYAATSDTLTDDSPHHHRQQPRSLGPSSYYTSAPYSDQNAQPKMMANNAMQQQDDAAYFSASGQTTNETDLLIGKSSSSSRHQHHHHNRAGNGTSRSGNKHLESGNFRRAATTREPDSLRWRGAEGGSRQQTYSASDATNTLSLERNQQVQAMGSAGGGGAGGGSLQRPTAQPAGQSQRPTMSRNNVPATPATRQSRQQQTPNDSGTSGMNQYRAYSGQGQPNSRTQSSLEVNQTTNGANLVSPGAPNSANLLSASAPAMPHSGSPFEGPPVLPPLPPPLPAIPSHRTNSPWMRLSGIILTPVGIVIVLFIVISPLLHYLM